MKHFELSYDVVDAIVLERLKDVLDSLYKDLAAEAAGHWMHPEDKILTYSKWIPATRALIEYFGEQPKEIPAEF